MARGRRRIRREPKAAGQPSIFFIVALAIGLVILFYFFAQTIRRPVNQGGPPAKHTSFHTRGHGGERRLV